MGFEYNFLRTLGLNNESDEKKWEKFENIYAYFSGRLILCGKTVNPPYFGEHGPIPQGEADTENHPIHIIMQSSCYEYFSQVRVSLT